MLLVGIDNTISCNEWVVYEFSIKELIGSCFEGYCTKGSYPDLLSRREIEMHPEHTKI